MCLVSIEVTLGHPNHPHTHKHIFIALRNFSSSQFYCRHIHYQRQDLFLMFGFCCYCCCSSSVIVFYIHLESWPNTGFFVCALALWRSPLCHLRYMLCIRIRPPGSQCSRRFLFQWRCAAAVCVHIFFVRVSCARSPDLLQ